MFFLSIVSDWAIIGFSTGSSILGIIIILLLTLAKKIRHISKRKMFIHDIDSPRMTVCKNSDMP